MADRGGFSGVLEPAGQLGRHFALVGGLTTLVAGLVPIALLAAGAPGQEPDLAKAADALEHLNLAEVGIIAVGIVALGLALHPLQFGVTQLLEGYWGTSKWSRRAMERSTALHLQAWWRLERFAREEQWKADDADTAISAVDKVESLANEIGVFTPDLLKALDAERQRLDEVALPHRIGAQEMTRALSKYPEERKDLMPTRLGNMLRRYERLAGEPYGLDAVTVTGPIVQVVDETLREYHDDARSDLDLAVRMVFVWAFTSVVALCLLWRYEVWLVVPLLTTGLAYISYRGAVAAAEAYGEALMALVALGRRPLYEALNVDFPRTSSEERVRNEELLSQLQGSRANMTFNR